MRFILRSLVSANLQPEDDIDKLFTCLPQVEPPDELITRILSNIQQLPESSAYSPTNQASWSDSQVEWEEQSLVIHNEQREPS